MRDNLLHQWSTRRWILGICSVIVQRYPSFQVIIKIEFELGHVDCPGLHLLGYDGEAFLTRARQYGGGSEPICPRFKVSDIFLFHHPDQVTHPKLGATLDSREMSIMHHVMFAFEDIRYQLVDFRNLVE